MERNNGIVNLAANGAIVIINGEERDTYCAPYGTNITWSVSKTGYISQSGSFVLSRDITLDIELLPIFSAGFHFKYDNDTMTIFRGEVAGVNDRAIFCIDGKWDILINGVELKGEGAETTTYGSEYLKSTGNDIYVVPEEGARIWRRNASANAPQAQYITEVISWGDCTYGNMSYFFGSNNQALLKSIPAFTEGFANATDFSYCFRNCSGLTSLPTGLFDNCTNATDFSSCFEGCSGLTSLPTGLFDNCTNATDFSSCFYYCSGLTSLPTGLFANCTNATDFSYCFYYCSGLTSLPTGLFANCTNATDFSYCFDGCSGLTSLPTGLFANCTNATNFSSCFRNCSGLTGESPYSILIIDEEEVWVHLYERCDYPDYFTCPEEHDVCFRACDYLDDYDQIPRDWK